MPSGRFWCPQAWGVAVHICGGDSGGGEDPGRRACPAFLFPCSSGELRRTICGPVRMAGRTSPRGETAGHSSTYKWARCKPPSTPAQAGRAAATWSGAPRAQGALAWVRSYRGRSCFTSREGSRVGLPALQAGVRAPPPLPQPLRLHPGPGTILWPLSPRATLLGRLCGAEAGPLEVSVGRLVCRFVSRGRCRGSREQQHLGSQSRV